MPSLPLDSPVLDALVRAAEDREVYLVGGFPRDFLLGRKSHDFDVVVSGGGREIAERVAAATGARVVPLGQHEQATYRLVGDGFVVDLLDRGPLSFEEDLWRRDFTLNAIAVALPSGRWLDVTGGRQDLARGLLRAPRDDAFSDDPLRILRLARFTAELAGFRAEEQTLDLARAALPSLGEVAAERIRSELDLLFRAPAAASGVACLVDLGVYPWLWFGEDTHPADGESLLDRLQRAEDLLAAGPPEGTGPGVLDRIDGGAVTWAASFSPGGPDGRAQTALEAFSRRGFASRRQATAIGQLLTADTMPADQRARRRFLHRFGDQWPSALLLAATQPTAERLWKEELRALTALEAAEGEVIKAPPTLLDGRSLQSILGRPPGPEIGRAQRALRLAQVDGEVTSRDAARQWLERWRKEKSSAGR